MRRLTISLVVAWLLSMTTSAITAQSPSASPATTTQPAVAVTAFPDLGIAIAFPDGWQVIEMPDHPPRLRGLTASGPGGYCEVLDGSTVEPALPVESIDGWLDAMISRWDDSLATRNVAGAVIDLPAGRVGQVTMDLVPSDANFWGEPGGYPDWGSLRVADRQAMYLFGDGRQWYFLGCSRGAPEDDWLSIAATFEFLPAAE